MSDADVLTALRGLEPASAPEWTPAQAPPVEPLQAAFAAEGDALYRYVSALSGRDAWLAEELVVRTFTGAAEEQDYEAAALFMRARHATLAVLAKADDAERPVAPAELALVLERRAGLGLEALARTWGVRPASLEARLLEAVQHYTTGDEACSDWKDPTVRATVDLLSEERAEAWAEHLMQCEACAAWSEALEAQLTHGEGLPSQERTWERIQAELSKHTRDLGIRVGVRCTYCHAGLPQAEASFCAACLAPHHSECFEEHGHCAAPACGGDALVYPQRLKPRIGRRVAWPWLLGGVLVGGAALAALDGGAATRLGFGGADPGEVQATEVRASRPVPLDVLRPGVGREAVIAALGEPEKVIADDYETVLAFYQQGARVTLDAKGRLIQAAFFGFHTSDEHPDASGNQRLGGPVGTYLPASWSYRGVEFGEPATSELLAGAVAPSVPDANGVHYLEVAKGVFAQLSPDMQLQAIFVAPNVTPDANGNVSPGSFDLSSQDARAIQIDWFAPRQPRAAVIDVLGPPDAEHELRGGGQRLSWYQQGVRVLFDAKDRLIQASFFGQQASDGKLAASGNRRIGGEGGLYSPGSWTYRGQRLGQPVDPSFVRGSLGQSTPDERGDHYLPVEEGVIAHLEAGSLRLLAVHRTKLRTYTSGERAGTVELVPFDLTPTYDASPLAARLLTEARAAGQLEQLCGTTRYRVEVDPSQGGRAQDLLQVEVALAPDGEGLEVTLDHWRPEREAWTWRRDRERVGWDGVLRSYARWERLGPTRLFCVRMERAGELYRRTSWRATLAGEGASARLLPEPQEIERASVPAGERGRVAGSLFGGFVLPRLLEVEELTRVDVFRPFRVFHGGGSMQAQLLPGVATDAAGATVRDLGKVWVQARPLGEVVRVFVGALGCPIEGYRETCMVRVTDDEWADRSALVAPPADPIFFWPGVEKTPPWELVEAEVVPAVAAVRTALAAARADGALERVLGSTFLVNENGVALARVTVERVDDGVVVTADLWDSRDGGSSMSWKRLEERVSWEGQLVGLRHFRAEEPTTLWETVGAREASRFAKRLYVRSFAELLSGQREQLEKRLKGQTFLDLDAPEQAEAFSGSLFCSYVLPRLRYGSVPLRVRLHTSDDQPDRIDLRGDEVTLDGRHGRWISSALVSDPVPQGAIQRVESPRASFLGKGTFFAISEEHWTREVRQACRRGDVEGPAMLVPGKGPTPVQLVEAEDPLALLSYRVVHEAPSLVDGHGTPNGIELRWEPNPKICYVVTRYEVWRAEDLQGEVGEWALLGESAGLQYLDTAAEPGKRYWYRIVSVAELDTEDPAVSAYPHLFRLDEVDTRKESARVEYWREE